MYYKALKNDKVIDVLDHLSFVKYQEKHNIMVSCAKEEAQAIIQKYPSLNSIVDCFDALIEFASHRKRTIMHIFRSVNREMFEQNLMEISEYFVQNYIDTALAGEMISREDKKAIIDYYKCVCFGLIIDWLNHGMTEEYAQSIRRIILLKKDYTLEMARSLQKQF